MTSEEQQRGEDVQVEFDQVLTRESEENQAQDVTCRRTVTRSHFNTDHQWSHFHFFFLFESFIFKKKGGNAELKDRRYYGQIYIQFKFFQLSLGVN